MLDPVAPRTVYRNGHTMAVIMEHNYMESAIGRAVFHNWVREWLRAGEEGAPVQRMMMG